MVPAAFFKAGMTMVADVQTTPPMDLSMPDQFCEFCLSF